ncbi:flavin-containing monooxygenase [Parasphingopyxis marina]|uniref:NAD(P)/FAD-dependent oxidoreductase n=1 Tax=Parasphingopyxis marina TaxID=2761622 RepID=A0A842HZH1_9SPHN|nr:NAD(P)/FAD-dependent oxidoreductase [Parasphingopyxis marina]MBC2778265.1 NAD(P)/FAD-dependent oxidoreductase [Parasphingopyxis marina]
MAREDAPQHFDVIVVGAGISGIGAGYYLQKNCPQKSYAILEGRENFGGTWDLFRYPGIRSDSDMFTLGYAFKPWTEQKAIADGPSIMNYLDETATQYGIHEKIRYRHMVRHASWSTEEAQWTVDVEIGEDKQPERYTCNFLFMCSGYYRYEAGYTPDFKGTDRFQGQIVHPQLWPEDLAYEGKRVIVIGSGATAVTLVPALVDSDTPAEHVTMLQRSPTYMVSRPASDKFANRLRKILPSKMAYAIIRWKHVLLQQLIFRRARTKPAPIKEFLIKQVREELGPDYDVETHFTPSYNPWEQRLCLVPDSDFFNAIKRGKASVATDHIDTFTEKGILLKSGEELEADIIVTATGLELQMAGGISAEVDGEPVNMAEHVSYKAMMFDDVPNFAISFGYTNASWTLRADLTCDYVCRLINHMDATGTEIATPRLPKDEEIARLPWVDFSSGYFQRAADKLPKQGDRGVWKNLQNYPKDIFALKYGKIADEAMEFTKRHPVGQTARTGEEEEPQAVAAE